MVTAQYGVIVKAIGHKYGYATIADEKVKLPPTNYRRPRFDWYKEEVLFFRKDEYNLEEEKEHFHRLINEGYMRAGAEIVVMVARDDSGLFATAWCWEEDWLAVEMEVKTSYLG